MIIEIEHRCPDCNKLVRFQKINVREVDKMRPLQVFNEVCDKCQTEADDG